jgi:hypothetical protein
MSASSTPALFMCLEGHAGGHSAVADDRDAVPLHALRAGSDRHAQRGRDRGRRMRGAEGVELAFAAPREAADAVILAQRRHAFPPSGKNLVCVGLVADVPHDAIVRRVVDAVQGHGQFDCAEIRRKMSAGARHRFNQESAQFSRQLRQLLAIQTAQVGRAVDGFKQGEGAHFRIVGDR